MLFNSNFLYSSELKFSDAKIKEQNIKKIVKICFGLINVIVANKQIGSINAPIWLIFKKKKVFALAQIAHNIKIKEDTYLYNIVGKSELKVNSRHKYHIPNELSFLASSLAEDGIIESIEYKDNRFTVGVQWHPETMIGYDNDSKKIIEEFIKKCKEK